MNRPISLFLLSAAGLLACTAEDTEDTADDAPDAGRFACTGVDRLFPGPCAQSTFRGEEAPVREVAFAYDAAGRRTLEERFAPGGGPQNKTTWLYDADGRLLDYREYYGDQLAVQSVCVHDVQGDRLTRVTCDGGPGGPDGTPETVDDYTYDAAGNVLTISSDGEPPFEAPDGTPDSVMTYTYDADGHRTGESLDSDANGMPDRVVTHEFDAGGHDVGLTRDQDGDGVPELTETRTYDASDRLTDETWDQDGDGVAEQTRHTTYDVDGRVTEVVSDGPGPFGDAIHVVQTRTYDAEGRLDVVEETWSDGSHRQIQHVYDEAGRLREVSSAESGPFGGDAEAPAGTAFTRYDCNGNVLDARFDVGDDDEIDSGTIYTYDDACWPRDGG
jgi:serralysin